MDLSNPNLRNLSGDSMIGSRPNSRVLFFPPHFSDLRLPQVEKLGKTSAGKPTCGTCESKNEKINKEWKTGKQK